MSLNETSQHELEIIVDYKDDKKTDDDPQRQMIKSTPTRSLTDSSHLSSFASRDFELEYSDEEGSIASQSPDDVNKETTTSKYGTDKHKNLLSTRTLSLVIDELPSRQSKSSISSPRQYNTSSTVKSKKVVACPCCKSYVDCGHNEKDFKFQNEQQCQNQKDALSTFMDSLWPSSEVNDSVSSPHDVSAKSLNYKINSRLVEGWLYKKGSGHDMLGSTFWKPRWCSLVVSFIIKSNHSMYEISIICSNFFFVLPLCTQMATVANNSYEEPLLLVSWHYSVNPSNVMLLESSIAIAVDVSDDSNTGSSQRHCFDIVFENGDNDEQAINNAAHKGNSPRTFSATLKERDHWVSTINQLVRDHEKSRTLSIRQFHLPPTSPTRSSRGSNFTDLNGLNITR